MGKGRKMYRVILGNSEGKKPFGRPRRRWEYGIKMDLGKIGWEGAEWIHQAQDTDRLRAFVNTVMNLWVLTPRS
jgi:hypothetical protein